MELNELFLKTAFSCMACDGEIASEELELVKQYAIASTLLKVLTLKASSMNMWLKSTTKDRVSWLVTSATLKMLS